MRRLGYLHQVEASQPLASIRIGTCYNGIIICRIQLLDPHHSLREPVARSGLT